MTILEVLIATALLAVGLLFVLSIVPTGVLSIKQSEDMVAATAYGIELIEDARRSLPAAGPQEFKIVLNQTEFKLTRDVTRVDDNLTDVVVTAHWNDTHPDVRLVTRLLGQPASPAP